MLTEVYEELEKKRALSENAKAILTKIYGKRFDNALKALQELAVKKYTFLPSERIVWIVVGKGRDYQVIPEAAYCSCDDFYYHVIGKSIPRCYHVIAQKLAAYQEKFKPFTFEDDMYETFMGEWRFIKEKDFSSPEKIDH